MMTFILHPHRKKIRASSLEDFADKYRRGSFRPEETLEAFMAVSAKRAHKIGIQLDPSSAEKFVLSLMQAGMVSLVKAELQ